MSTVALREIAEAIAREAGADVDPQPFRPVLRGLLLTGGAPRFLRTHLDGGGGNTSVAADEALWWPPAKVVGRYLAPFLAGRASLTGESPAGGIAVEVDLSDVA